MIFRAPLYIYASVISFLIVYMLCVAERLKCERRTSFLLLFIHSLMLRKSFLEPLNRVYWKVLKVNVIPRISSCGHTIEAC